MLKKNIVEPIIGMLAIASIILVAVESLMTLSDSALWGIYIADLIICLVFAADFIQRLVASERKLHFMKTNGYEILAMVPAIALYGLGAIPGISAAMRSLRLIRVIRVILLLFRMRRAVSRSGGFFRRSHLLTMFIITFVIIFIGAMTVLILETESGETQITNFSDAVWWSISTVTTVGYGDIVPQSIAGRVMGMILMVIGIGVMTLFISQVSATLVESRMKKRAEKEDLKSSIKAEIKSRIDNIDKLNDSDVSLLMDMIRTLKVKEGDNGQAGADQ